MPDLLTPPVADPPTPAAPPVAATPPADPPAVPPTPPPAAPPVVPPVAPVADAPIAYDLKLPVESRLDPAVVGTMTALLGESKVPPDHAQKFLDHVNTVAAAHAAAELASHLPGGAAYDKQQTDWKAAALADPDLGNGKPESLDAALTLGKRVLATFFPKESIDFLEQSGLGSSPAVLKGLVSIGKRMKEDDFVSPNTPAVPNEKSIAERMWPNAAKETT